MFESGLEEQELISTDYLEEENKQLAKLFHILEGLPEFAPFHIFKIIMNKDSGKISCCVNNPKIDFQFVTIAEFYGKPLDNIQRTKKFNLAVKEFDEMAIKINPGWSSRDG